MALQFQVKGRPLRIREAQYQGKSIICLDFEESSKAAPPANLPKPEEITATALISNKQWKSLLKQINDAGDTMETSNHLPIVGEIISITDEDISFSDITYVAFSVKYIPFREGQKTTESTIEIDKNINTDFSTINVEPPKKKKATVQIAKPKKKRERSNRYTKALKDMTQEEIQLHAEKNGVCSSCGQRCDKRVVHVVERDGQKDIICSQCKYNKPLPTTRIDRRFVDEFSKEVGIENDEAYQFLISFPKTYALQFMDDKYRMFWSWDSKNRVNQIRVMDNGFISMIALTDGKTNTVVKKLNARDILGESKKRESKKIFIKGVSYEWKDKVTLKSNEIKIPIEFQNHPPNPKKVEDKIDFYKRNNQFKRALVAIKEEEGYYLIDGYSSYVAGKQLNIDEYSTILVEKL